MDKTDIVEYTLLHVLSALITLSSEYIHVLLADQIILVPARQYKWSVLSRNYVTTRDGINLTLICINMLNMRGGGGTMRMNRWVCFHHIWNKVIQILNFCNGGHLKNYLWQLSQNQLKCAHILCDCIYSWPSIHKISCRC